MIKKKGPVIKNISNDKSRRYRQQSSRVVVGHTPNISCPWSITVQESVSFYIMKYNLKCSISQFKNRINWNKFLSENKLSNEFLEAFVEEVPIGNLISQYQKLSESFMEKHEDELNWSHISLFQDISKKFILKHIDKLNKDVLINQRFLITQEEIDYAIQEQEKEFQRKIIDESVDSRADILDL
jgi:hypothetical protein